MRMKNIIAAVCGVILIACMAAGLPVFAAEADDVAYVDMDGDERNDQTENDTDEAIATQTNDVVYVDIDGDGQISQSEKDYAEALKAMQDYHERLAAREAAGLTASEELLVPEDALGNETSTVESENTTDGDAEAAETDRAAEETTEDTEEPDTWEGEHLTKLHGTVKGPSGRETYYNLNMTPVLTLAQQRGVDGSYWVRDDGVKMYGDYIIVAANYRVHPYGSLVETSLGTGIVLDTGGFASYAPRLIDIATRW